MRRPRRLITVASVVAAATGVLTLMGLIVSIVLYMENIRTVAVVNAARIAEVKENQRRLFEEFAELESRVTTFMRIVSRQADNYDWQQVPR